MRGACGQRSTLQPDRCGTDSGQDTAPAVPRLPGGWHGELPGELPGGLGQRGIAGGPSWLCGANAQRLAAEFVAAGIVLRMARYLLCFPLWGDEAMLAVNFLDRGYGELLQPLDHLQVAPPLFLWIELTAVKLLGFSEYSLRLFPTLCSVVALLLYARLAASVLRGLPLVAAVAILSVAYYPIRHGAEVKPYASDLLAAVVLLGLGWRGLQPGGLARALGWLAACVPLAVVGSYPSVFVAGGVSLSLLRAVWRSGRGRIWAAYAVYNLALLGSFTVLYWGVIDRSYAQSYHGGVGAYWREAFPPLAEPAQLPRWLLETHTSHMFAYPIGGERGASVLTTLGFLLGAWTVWRSGRRGLLALCLWPFALALVAAALHRYPYGGSARFMLYLAPGICLLAGLGAAVAITWLRQPRWRHAAAAALVAGYALVGGGMLLRDLARPYKTPADHVRREFARWFWRDMAQGAELVCIGTDLKRDLFAGQWKRMSPEYLCLQRIYSARHRAGVPPQWERISTAHRLRCVVHRADGASYNARALQQWLDEMEQRYDLVEHTDLVVNAGMESIYAHHYEVFEFVPEGQGAMVRRAPAGGGLR